MTLIKIHSITSPRQVMFLDHELYRWKEIQAVVKRTVVSLEFGERFKNEITPSYLPQILLDIDSLIEGLILSSDFLNKDSGYPFEFKGQQYFLDTKVYTIDKEITTLNSFRKIVTYCFNDSSNLSLETYLPRASKA